MIFISGCSSFTSSPQNNSWLVAESLPPFPAPHKNAIEELREVCPAHKCKALYEWVRRLKVLHGQLELYKGKWSE